MAATVGSLRIELSASIAQFQADMGKAASAVKSTAVEFTKAGNDFKKIGAQMQSVGMALTKSITLPLAALGGSVAKVGIDFETAFAGVRKTVAGAVDDLGQLTPVGQRLQQGFRDLAKEIPVSVNELARLGEAAGALGIPTTAVLGFAKVMAELGVTTNLTSDQAAESIAKIQNTFGAAGQNTEQFASTLVALGNAGASTESEILEMGKRIAGAGHTIGLTQGQVLAFGSALSSVGIEAEAGGSAISRVFVDLAQAVSHGGSELERFARVAGQSSADFAKAFKTDAAGATTTFIEGLGKIQQAGGDVFGTLESLGITEVRLRDALLRAAGAGDLLRDSLKLQAAAWQNNSALTKEAEQRFRTTESQLTLLWNRIKDVGITLFTSLKPAIDASILAMNKMLPYVEMIAKAFGSLPGGVQLAIIGVGAFAAALGPAIYIGGQLVSSLAQLTLAFGKGGIGTRVLVGALGVLEKGLATVRLASAGLTATFGSVALPVAAFVALGFALNETAKGVKNLVNAWNEGHLWETLTAKDDDTWARRWLGLSKGIDSTTLSAKQLGTGFVSTMPAVVGLGAAVAETGVHFTGTVGPTKAAQAALERYREAVAELAKTLSGASATEELRKLKDAFHALPPAATTNEGVMKRVSDAFEKLADTLDVSKLPKDLQVFVKRMEDVSAEVAAAERVERILNTTFANGVEPIKGLTMSWGELLNIARGFTSSGVLPSYIDQNELAAAAAKKFEEQILRTREALKNQLAGVIMLPNVKQAYDAATDGAEQATDKHKEWLSTLDNLSSAFAQLAQISGGTFGGVVKDIGTVISAMNLAEKSADEFKKATTTGGKIAAAAGGIAAVAQATSAKSTGAAVVGGALSGAAVGSIVPGVGTAIGAGVGALVGLIRSIHKGPGEKAAIDVGRELGVTISESLAKEIGEQGKSIGRQAATVFNLDKIIAEGGGLRADNIQAFTAKLRDTFVLVKTGALNAASGAAVLDKNFATFASAFLENGPLISKELVEIVRLTDDLGASSKAVSEFINQQVTGTILPGLQAYAGASKDATAALKENQQKLADLQDQLAKATPGTDQEKIKKDIADVTAAIQKEQGVIAATGVTSQAAADALSASVAVAFAEMMKAGTPILDIVDQLEPVVAALGEQFAAAGFAGGAAFQNIQSLVGLAADEIAGPALQATMGLGQALAGLSNIGQLNQETFSGLSDQIAATFNSLVAQGKDGNQVLALMQGPLQTIWQLSTEFGYAVDDGTKALLDQALAAGVVGEKFKGPQQQMIDALATTNSILGSIATALGATLPAAAQTAAAGITTAFSRVNPQVNVDINYNDPGFTPDVSAAGNVPGFRSGSGGVQDFGGGTLAMLHGREAVVTEHELTRGSQQSATGTGGDPIVVNVSISAVDSGSFRDLMTRNGGGADIIIDSISQGKRGRDERLRRGLALK